MRKIPKATYLSLIELEACIRDRELAALALPVGETQRVVLKEIAQLKVHANMKRWLAPASKAEMVR